MKLTEAHLNHAQRAKRLHGTPLHELLLSSGAMEGPARKPPPLTVTTPMRILRAIKTYLNNRKAPPCNLN